MIGAHDEVRRNHLTRIAVGAASIDLHYVLDDAEIPTFTLLRALDAHGTPTQAQLDALQDAPHQVAMRARGVRTA